MAINVTPAPSPFHITSVTARPIWPEEEPHWNALMEDVHPLGNARFAGHRIKYVVEMRGHAVALLCFSGCAYHLADRDRHIGWTVEQAMQQRHLVVQNSRRWADAQVPVELDRAQRALTWLYSRTFLTLSSTVPAVHLSLFSTHHASHSETARARSSGAPRGR